MMRKAKLVMTAKQMEDRAAWLKARAEGIGGTDASIIMGMSRFKTLHRLWAEKTGRYEPEDLADNEAVHFGAVIEEIVAQEFTLRTGKKVRKQGLLRSLEHPWMLASVDRMLVGEEAGLECKTASFTMRHEWDEERTKYGIPDGYYCQVQWYMAVTGLPLWYIACLIGGQHYVMREIPRDEAFIARMVQAAGEFWMCVAQDRLPAVDGTQDCARNLNILYRGAEGRMVNLPGEIENAIRHLQDVEGRLELLEMDKTLQENRVKEYLKDAEYGKGENGYFARWKPTKRFYKGTNIPIRKFTYGKGVAQ